MFFIKVHILVPVTTVSFDFIACNAQLAEDAGIVLTQSHIPEGPETTECELDGVLCAAQVVREAIRAAEAGVDAIMVTSMSDPGLEAVREVIRGIPVIGIGQASMLHAKQLGSKFCIVPTVAGRKHYYEKQARVYGLESSLAGVKASGISVADIHKDVDKAVEVLYGCFLEMAEAGAEVGILGCGCFQDMNTKLNPFG